MGITHEQNKSQFHKITRQLRVFIRNFQLDLELVQFLNNKKSFHLLTLKQTSTS